MVYAREQHHDGVGSRSAHELREEGRTLTEDDQLKFKASSLKSLSMRKFVGNCGVDRMRPIVPWKRAASEEVSLYSAHFLHYCVHIGDHRH